MQQPQEFPKWLDGIFCTTDLLPSTVNISELPADQEEFYKSHINLSADKIKVVAKETTTQSKSSLWIQERKKRVTASRAKQLIGARKKETRLKYFQQGPSSSLPALRYKMQDICNYNMHIVNFLHAYIGTALKRSPTRA